IPLTDVLDADRQLLVARNDVESTRADAARAAVRTFRALGGGGGGRRKPSIAAGEGGGGALLPAKPSRATEVIRKARRLLRAISAVADELVACSSRNDPCLTPNFVRAPRGFVLPAW